MICPVPVYCTCTCTISHPHSSLQQLPPSSIPPCHRDSLTPPPQRRAAISFVRDQTGASGIPTSSHPSSPLPFSRARLVDLLPDSVRTVRPGPRLVRQPYPDPPILFPTRLVLIPPPVQQKRPAATDSVRDRASATHRSLVIQDGELRRLWWHHRASMAAAATHVSPLRQDEAQQECSLPVPARHLHSGASVERPGERSFHRSSGAERRGAAGMYGWRG
jgi:hypothetical protein